MKKFVIAATIVALTGVAAFFGTKAPCIDNRMSDLQLANAEALAVDYEIYIEWAKSCESGGKDFCAMEPTKWFRNSTPHYD